MGSFNVHVIILILFKIYSALIRTVLANGAFGQYDICIFLLSY